MTSGVHTQRVDIQSIRKSTPIVIARWYRANASKRPLFHFTHPDNVGMYSRLEWMMLAKWSISTKHSWCSKYSRSVSTLPRYSMTIVDSFFFTTLLPLRPENYFVPLEQEARKRIVDGSYPRELFCHNKIMLVPQYKDPHQWYKNNSEYPDSAQPSRWPPHRIALLQMDPSSPISLTTRSPCTSKPGVRGNSRQMGFFHYSMEWKE